MHLKIPTIDKSYKPMDRSMKSGKITKDKQKAFAEYMAHEMRNALRAAIKNQRYKKQWAPLSVRYLEHKREHNLSLNIWEASSYLIESITVRKYGDHYIVGFPHNKVYPGTRIRVEQVAKWMEYGTETMPARPLFGRIYEYMRKHVNDYYKKFMLIP